MRILDDVAGRWLRDTPFVALWGYASRESVDEDAVVACVDRFANGYPKAPELRRGDVSFEDAALDVVEVLPTSAEDFRVALGGGVVDNDDVQLLPPDPERLVGGFLQAGAGELEGFEV